MNKMTKFQKKVNVTAANDFKKKSINCLKQALDNVQTHFPGDFPHVVRIQSKFNFISYNRNNANDCDHLINLNVCTENLIELVDTVS
jgi:hypothetical protein